MSLPQTQKSWVIAHQKDFSGLQLDASAKIPEVGENDVLVRIRGASLNYRDLTIANNTYPLPTLDAPFIPGSDGAGEVVKVGRKVSRFSEGDKVVAIFSQEWIAGECETLDDTLGGSVDGTLRQYAVFNEQGLVHMPSNLNFVEAATLTCAGVTAWNCLYGVKPLLPGQTVLTQGTGGVSIFAAQFALAAGATVIATTSSDEKAEMLKKLGVQHVINYKKEPEWGAKARSLTKKGAGVDHIVEVGGPATMKQSLEAIRYGGTISLVGYLAGTAENAPGFMDSFIRRAIVRGILVGSRLMFEDMNRAIEANNIKPVVDPNIFKFDELRDAYQYQWDQKHFGKVGIEFD